MALELKDDADITTVTDAELIPDGDKDTSYQVRHLTTDKHREIVKTNTQKVPNRRTHQRDDVTDWEKATDDMLDYILTGWSGVVAKGEPLECVWEHKKRLDAVRKSALLEKAGMNEIAATSERRAESFRPLTSVR